MRLYIIRHADPDYENDDLTELGCREAKALSDGLEGVHFDAIYSSPMGRAQATAQYTAERKAMTYDILSWAAELRWRIDREAEGNRPCAAWNIDGHEVRRDAALQQVDGWSQQDPLDDPRFVAEYEQLKAESDAFFAQQGYIRDGGVYRFEHANPVAIAVFCHGGFGLTWLSHLLALPLPLVWTGFFMRPSSITTLLFDERTPGLATPRCIGLGDVTHLHMSGLANAKVPGGIVANYE